MLILPGMTAVTQFNVHQAGDLSSVGSMSFLVFRNDIETTIAPAVVSSVAGRYTVSFTIPSNWEPYDKVSVSAMLTYGSGAVQKTIECNKGVAMVDPHAEAIDYIADLLTADQVYDPDTGQIVYYRAGTNQTVELHRQDVSGTTCADNEVSLIQP